MQDIVTQKSGARGDKKIVLQPGFDRESICFSSLVMSNLALARLSD